MLSRAQIEEMLSAYYTLFHTRPRSDFGAYFTEDGVLDANGVVAQGRAPINDLYKHIPDEGSTHVLISNPRIAVDGNSATVDLVWTEVVSENPLAQPHIVEQGREHDDLVKRQGRWLFLKRIVTNDGGLPAALEKFRKER
jgi:hypothetical protein